MHEEDTLCFMLSVANWLGNAPSTCKYTSVLYLSNNWRFWSKSKGWVNLRGIDTQGEVKWVTEGLWWRDRQTTRWRKITKRESGSVERKTRSSTKKEKMTLDKTKHKKTRLEGKKTDRESLREGTSESTVLNADGAEQLSSHLMSGLLTETLSLFQSHVLL